MSSPNSHNEQGRPLTRRELRELAEKQALLATPNPQVNAAPQPAFPPTAQGASTPAPTHQSAAPVRRTTARPAPTRSVPGANTPIPHEAIGRLQRPGMDSRPSGAESSVGRSPEGTSRGSAQPASPYTSAPAAEQGGLRSRPVVTPTEQPVQVTRRSMYTQAPAAGVPQVTPPAQAGAVRMLEETGTLSRLVDPREFEPSRQPVAPPRQGPSEDRARMLETNTATAPAVPRSNLAGFMRQAPPSSQIPRVERDEHGNWRASSGAEVQDRVAQTGAVLPQWDAGSSPFAEFSSRVGQTQDGHSFTPQQQVGGSGLPARSSAFQTQGQRAESAAGSIEGEQARETGVTGGFTAATAPPAWEAITSVDSTLPVDPTAGGVAVSSLLAQTQSATHQPGPGVGASGPTPLGGGLSTPPGSRGPIVDEPTAAMAAVSQELPVSFAPGSGGTGAQGQQNPFGAAPFGEQPDQQPSGFGDFAGLQVDETVEAEDLDEEDAELDHSYTWLHYMILVAVAFVLGMVIWKVALDSEPADPGAETEAASVSVNVDPLALRA